MSIFGFGSSGGGLKAGPIWGLAATLALTVLVTIQVLVPEDDQVDVYRGGASATVLIVDNPLQRKNELLNGLFELFSPPVTNTHTHHTAQPCTDTRTCKRSCQQNAACNDR